MINWLIFLKDKWNGEVKETYRKVDTLWGEVLEEAQGLRWSEMGGEASPRNEFPLLWDFQGGWLESSAHFLHPWLLLYAPVPVPPQLGGKASTLMAYN
jgi:hypothetical protein